MNNTNKKAVLTAAIKKIKLFANGFCRPKKRGTEAMCIRVHGFFYVFPVMVEGVVGGDEPAGRLVPVCKPVTSSAALSFAAPSGGYSPYKELSMNSFLNGLAASAPLRHKITIRLLQLRYLRCKRLVRTALVGGVA